MPAQRAVGKELAMMPQALSTSARATAPILGNGGDIHRASAVPMRTPTVRARSSMRRLPEGGHGRSVHDHEIAESFRRLIGDNSELPQLIQRPNWSVALAEIENALCCCRANPWQGLEFRPTGLVEIHPARDG